MTEIRGIDRTNFDNFCGYHQTWEGQPDPLLTRTGPGDTLR